MFTNRWNPLEDLISLHRDMDRVFGRQWGEGSPRQTNGAWTPQSEVASYAGATGAAQRRSESGPDHAARQHASDQRRSPDR